MSRQTLHQQHPQLVQAEPETPCWPGSTILGGTYDAATGSARLHVVTPGGTEVVLAGRVQQDGAIRLTDTTGPHGRCRHGAPMWACLPDDTQPSKIAPPTDGARDTSC